jgi:hypothetical protein
MGHRIRPTQTGSLVSGVSDRQGHLTQFLVVVVGGLARCASPTCSPTSCLWPLDPALGS